MLGADRYLGVGMEGRDGTPSWEGVNQASEGTWSFLGWIGAEVDVSGWKGQSRVCTRACVCRRWGDPTQFIGTSEPALWEEG